MQVFVTGATGVLGSRVVGLLDGRGHDVVGLVRDEEGAATVERRGGTPARGDVLEPHTLTGPAGDVDVVVHAATAIPTADKPSDDDWARNDRVRLEGARNLVDVAGDAVERVYFPSVVWLARQPDGSTFDETAERYPDRATRSAAETEDFLEAAGDEHGFDAAVLRFGFFYAPDATHTRQWGEMLLDRSLPVVGGGLLGRRDAEFSFVHADDAARAVADAVDAEAAGLYHVVDDEPVTVATFLRTFADLLEAPEPRRVPAWLARFFVGTVAAETLTSPMPTTNRAFADDVGWSPASPTYREGLQQVVEAWLDDGTIRETDDGFRWAGRGDDEGS
jgi:nucleoside-diphosphate-sugar epimerase